MFTAVSLVGRVTKDVELKTSSTGTKYVQFGLAVNKGYGEQQHPNFYQCSLFGEAAERMTKAKVRKGSLVNIIGDLDVTEYVNSSKGQTVTNLNVRVYDWDYIPVAKKNSDEDSSDSAPSGTEGNSGFASVEDCGQDGLPFH